jgi:glycosyltransferase involved in cell wall biosynthesis
MRSDTISERSIPICIVVENMPVPADPRVWREALTLQEAGYTVSVICPKGRGFDRSRETLNGIEIYRHRAWEAPGLWGYCLEYTWALLMESILVLKVFWRTRFRILQACNPPDTIFIIALLLKLFGVRFVFDQHDPTPELYEAKFERKDLVYWAIREAERLTFQTADVALVTNDSCRELAIERGGIAPQRCFVVRNCPRLTDFPSRPSQLNLKEGFEHLALYLGMMGSQDGLHFLLESVDHIVNHQQRKDTLFVFAGAGPELDALKARARELKIDSFVRFTGMIYGDRLRAYLATADIGVSPDPLNVFNNKLTMIKILEYMASGIPVVLYDLVEGRRSAAGAALYAKANDPIDFAERIITLLDSEPLREKLGSIGRQRIQDRLNWETESLSLLKAYQVALGSAPASSLQQAPNDASPTVKRTEGRAQEAHIRRGNQKP